MLQPLVLFTLTYVTLQGVRKWLAMKVEERKANPTKVLQGKVIGP